MQTGIIIPYFFSRDTPCSSEELKLIQNKVPAYNPTKSRGGGDVDVRLHESFTSA